MLSEKKNIFSKNRSVTSMQNINILTVKDSTFK